MNNAMPQSQPAPGRACDGCTLCCKVIRVDVLAKPQWQYCPHCVVGQGCGIHATRPDDCRAWFCEYLKNPGMADDWYPKTSHMVIEVLDDGINAHVYVDPDHPDAWTTEPYYSDLKASAEEAVKRRSRITVHVGTRQIILFPDRDVVFDNVAADEEVIVVFPSKAEDRRRWAAYQRKIGGDSLGPEHWR
jgi:hypothetical protein